MTTGDVFILGLAAASMWMLVVRDTITQPYRHWLIRHVARKKKMVPDKLAAPGVMHRPSRNAVTWWLEYLIGCPLCFTAWASGGLYAAYEWGPSWLNTTSRAAQVILAGRLIAWGVLKWLQDNTTRDWPDGFDWPPKR